MAYYKIANVDVAVATSSITFSSIPSTYTDLFIITNERSANTVTVYNTIATNGVTNYHNTWTGTRLGSPTSGADNYAASGRYAIQGDSGLAFGNSTIYISNYSNTSNKVGFTFSTGASQNFPVDVDTWAACFELTTTSTAGITTITLAQGSGTFAVGSNFTLYGILKGSGGGTIS